MGIVAAVATVVSAVAGVGSAIASNRRQRKIAREQRRQNEIRNRLARQQQARNIRRQLAASRVRAAEAQQAGFAFGVPGSTSQQQAVGAQATDFASSVGAAQQQLGVQELVAESQNRISSIASERDPFAVVGAAAGALSNAQANRAFASGFQSLTG